MIIGPAPARPPLIRALRGASRVLRSASRATGHRVRRAAVAQPLDTGGFLGASVAGWISTSPSLLPRTWWMWMVNISFSQTYGYAAGYLAERLLLRGMRAFGLHVDIEAGHRRQARMIGAGALIGISAYSWVRGVMRQREISHLVQEEPKNLATHVVGTAAGVGSSFAILAAVRAVRATGSLYRTLLRPVLPARVVGTVSIVLTAITVGVLVERIVRGRLIEQMIERSEEANRLISPEIPRPTSALRSGSPASNESWESLGAPGRRIVAGGAGPDDIEQATGRPAMEPIRVYAGKSTTRPLEQTIDAVLAELDRTGAWDREVLVLYTGTGTGWLQEWSLSALEFLTDGNCATASVQYSVYTSALSFLIDRRTPQRAGHQLFHAVRRRLDRIPREQRPRLYVAGESLGAYGGQAAFRDVPEMLRKVDGAVWTGTPGFTPMFRRIVAASRPGAPAIAPIVDNGRHIRVVTRPRDLYRDYWGGLYEPWQHPRVVYAQHPSDPVVFWDPRLLWDEPEWLRERVGHDVTRAMRWFPWITFWQISSDMPLSIKTPGGHGHSYMQEMVPIWASVLGQDVDEEHAREQRERHQGIIRAIRALNP